MVWGSEAFMKIKGFLSSLSPKPGFGFVVRLLSVVTPTGYSYWPPIEFPVTCPMAPVTSWLVPDTWFLLRRALVPVTTLIHPRCSCCLVFIPQHSESHNGAESLVSE